VTLNQMDLRFLLCSSIHDLPSPHLCGLGPKYWAHLAVLCWPLGSPLTQGKLSSRSGAPYSGSWG
jgi:hypothetical protein